MAATTPVSSATGGRGAGARRRTRNAKTDGAVLSRVKEFTRLLDRPLTSYYLLVGSSVLLIVLGLVMVLSSSMVDSYTETGSAFSLFLKQAVAALIGIPLMLLASRLPPRTLRLLGGPLLLVSIVLLVITTFRGVEYYGATRWLNIGGITVQASEPAKLAFALWGANLLARKEELRELTEWRHLLVPLLPVCGILVLLVLMGSDLGTSFVLMAVLVALLWIIGAPGRLFFGVVGLVGLLVAIMIAVEPYRLKRLTAFLNPEADPFNSGYQLLHGLYALGTGGLLGVGIGASREKWGHLPHPESDFIFAIIGEEFGLLGTLLVIGLFGVLGYSGLRVAARTTDPFVRLSAVAITTWICVQAMVNIGTVIGVLPVTGIPLPFVSAGGSSLIPTMLGMGVLLALARNEPAARSALSARGPTYPQRALSWLGLGNSAGRTAPGADRAPKTRPTQVQARRNRRR
ncbi:cell division protein FtsW [Thermobifida fusca YX]|jgi:cell division protein FtsW|uniref:Probable peptidoglycan glycosyltransferase FtsW n=1 Tax=Thermobifida fusca (strain YX) TaxID=269800 RepID=Q47QX0_THEFY|nr:MULTISPECIES: putative lipid II flippase FtsW [Thermobifida]AAZ55147.1 cell division protein FtsW [Thermobifida fusca YX]MBO2528779.1 putative lipid II flippase FtsW [Thermobifida sp.]MDD6791491.1 putative lipid II flippase FtsW [Thermobifida fusca]PPS96029.1 cell division protein FtsW [Thermobifida fusca]PZN65367.1 MAG: putative lipid II flippase FtsW [Thermobifida fusca]